MRSLFVLFTLVLVVGAGQTALSQSLVINEFIASNDTVLADEFGDFDDWVELYNSSASAIDIAGMYLTDDLAEPNKWQIPVGFSALTTVPAGGFLVLWFDGEPQQGALHVDAKLSGGGEDVGLFAADLTAVDSLSYGPQSTDVSHGRSQDGGSDFVFFATPTPGAPNEGGTTEATAEPTADVPAGAKSSPITVTLEVTTSDAQIYFTTDATEPDQTSASYTGPIVINDTTVLRARAFSPGRLPSRVNTFSYLFGVSHSPDFALVAVTVEPESLFGENGIYTLFDEDIEVPAHFELFEGDGTLALSQRVETEIHGNASAAQEQKSLAIKADASFGDDELRYPVFADLPHDSYRSLILRSSGQDWNYTMFRDSAASSMVRDLTDVGTRIERPDVILQGHRPAVVYLNGAYWGIHNIRERFDHRYIKSRYGLDRDQIDFIDEDADVRDGDTVAWQQFQGFLEAANLNDPSSWSTFESWLDPDAFRDYNVFSILIDNADWPGNNNRRFRARVPGARWQYMLKDLDFSTGLFVDEGPWNSGDWTQDSLARLLDDQWDWWPDPLWATLAIRRAVENDGFRHDFINRSADMLNVLFGSARWNSRISEFETVYQPEMQGHLDRWNGGWNNWTSHVDVLRLFVTNRAPAVRDHFIGFFPELTGTAKVDLAVDGSGGFSFSTVQLDGDNDSYNGTWFTGIPIPVVAVPEPGFVFERWSGASTSTHHSIEVVLSGDSSLTAHFSDGGGGPLPQLILFSSLSERTVASPPFELSATASSGLPVHYTVVSGPATVNGSTVTLAGTLGTVTIRASQAGNSSWFAARDVDQSFEVVQVSTGGPMPTGYCSALGDQPWQSWIKTVRFAEINDDSEKERYADKTHLEATAPRGSSVGIELIPGYSWERFHNTWRVWIDWNRDGDFGDAGELALDAAPGNQNVQSQIVVPGSASLGATRMRVVMKRDSAVDACQSFLFGEVQDYAVLVGGTGGGQQAQTILFGPLPQRPVDATPFDVAATASSGLPVSFSLVSGPGQIAGSTISLNGTVGTIVVRASQAGNSSWLEAPPVDRSFEVVEVGVGGPMPTGYCASIGHQPWQSWIETVRFGDIDHMSLKERYGDFTAVSTAAARGSMVPVELAPAYSWEEFLNTWRVWVDWNRDGDFADAGELALDVPVTNQVVADQIQIPPSASVGTTRMRVTMKRLSPASACESFTFGEVQDYAVDVF